MKHLLQCSPPHDAAELNHIIKIYVKILYSKITVSNKKKSMENSEMVVRVFFIKKHDMFIVQIS